MPWIDHVCAAELLARLGALNTDCANTADIITGSRIISLDPQADSGPARLIASAAIAEDILIPTGGFSFQCHA